ncbi:MAG TPA: ATP-binding protein [Candidatus Sulfotelmatobacter sp.]
MRPKLSYRHSGSSSRCCVDESLTREHPDIALGRYVMLAVGDHGTGLNEATRTHIFGPFFTAKEMGKRSGLGLATV